MKTKLEIDLALLPEEGKQYTGELDSSIFGLSERDAKPVGNLYYELYIQRFENELLVRGYLSSPFEFMCVRDNSLFTQTISLEEFATSIEIESSSIDLTEALREEVLINFPAYPRCDEGDEPKECKINEKYLAVDKPLDDEVNEAPASEGDSRWGALDALNDFNE